MVQAKRTVAIIGAGPSGITTAKSMLEVGFQPTVFEARSQVGGLWAPRGNAGDVETHELHRDMTTNSTEFLDSFSDYFPLKEGDLRFHTTTTKVDSHLVGFARRYIPDDVFRFNTRVLNVAAEEGPDAESPSWRVTSEHVTTGDQREQVFDYIVLATGMFCSPWLPHKDTLKNFPGRCIHTTEYEGATILGPVAEGKKQKILVVGGTFSASENAADIALRVSSLPEPARSQVEILHVLPTPFRLLPKLLPIPNPDEPEKPRILPADLFFFTVEGMAAGPPPNSPEEKSRMISGLLAMVTGTDQSDLHPALTLDDRWASKPVVPGLSPHYDKLVKSGVIKPVIGRFDGITEDGKVRLTDGEGNYLYGGPLGDVDTISFATGYTMYPSLQKILSPGLMVKLGLEPDLVNPPHLKEVREKMNGFAYVLAPGVGRTFGFVGTLGGAFWGAFEMQGRYLASIYSGRIPWPKEDIEEHAKGVDYLMSVGKIREAFVKKDSEDYLSLIGYYAKCMGDTTFFEVALAEKHRPRSWAIAYLKPFAEMSNDEISLRKEQRENGLRLVRKTITELSSQPRLVSQSVFAELNGKWKMTTKILKPGQSSVEYTGTAEFRPRIPTFSPVRSPGEVTAGPVKPQLSLGRMPMECVYSEDGNLPGDAAAEVGGRKYVYRYDTDDYSTTVWSVNSDASEGVGSFIYDLDFGKAPEKLGTAVDEKGGYTASAVGHGEESWKPSYRFAYKAIRLQKFWAAYKVNDHVVEKLYERV